MDKYEIIQYRISIVLKIFIGILIFVSASQREIFLVFSSSLVLFLSFIPAIVSRSFKIKLPIEIDLIITIFLYLHYVLGEYSHFYVKIWWWDIFLHFGNSLILGMAGFILAYALLVTSRIVAKPLVISLFALSFAVLVGAIWEIFEFGMDIFFGFSMQKSGLVDTMIDLIMDVGGALLVSAWGFWYIKKPTPGIFDRIIKRFVEYKYIKNS